MAVPDNSSRSDLANNTKALRTAKRKLARLMIPAVQSIYELADDSKAYTWAINYLDGLEGEEVIRLITVVHNHEWIDDGQHEWGWNLKATVD